MSWFRLILLCLAMLCSSSFAVNTWESPPETVTLGVNPSTPQIVTDSAGNSHTVWYDGTIANYSVYYSYRPYGGNWGTPVTLAEALTSVSTISIVADLTTHPTAYVGWLSGTILQATTVAYPYTSGATPTIVDNSGFAQSFSLAYNQQNFEGVAYPGAIIVYEYYDPATLSGVYYAVSSGSGT